SPKAISQDNRPIRLEQQLFAANRRLFKSPVRVGVVESVNATIKATRPVRSASDLARVTIPLRASAALWLFLLGAAVTPWLSSCVRFGCLLISVSLRLGGDSSPCLGDSVAISATHRRAQPLRAATSADRASGRIRARRSR